MFWGNCSNIVEHRINNDWKLNFYVFMSTSGEPMPTNQSNGLILIGSLFSVHTTHIHVFISISRSSSSSSSYHFLLQCMRRFNFHPFIAINIKIYWLKPIYAIDRLKCFCVYLLSKIKCTLDFVVCVWLRSQFLQSIIGCSLKIAAKPGKNPETYKFHISPITNPKLLLWIFL